MNASYPSFLDENASRFYPFAEGESVVVPSNTSGLSDNDIFLDFRGWSRRKLLPAVRLIAADAAYSDGSHTPHPGLDAYSRTGNLMVFFEAFFTTDSGDLGSRVACFYIPLGMPDSDFPYTSISGAAMPNGAKWWEAKIVVTKKAYDLVDLSGVEFDGSGNPVVPESTSIDVYQEYDSALEPCQFFEIGGIAVDQLNVIPDMDNPQSARYLSGKVSVIPGANTSVSQSGKSISVSARLGGGTGRSVYSGKDLGDACSGLLSINGVSPDKSGNFYVKGGGGILVEDIPASHEIRISLDKNNRAFAC